MSIIIKGMEMPNRCESCGFVNPYRRTCGLTGTRILGDANARLDNCPIIEIKPHGRLIDADQARKDEEIFWDLDTTHRRYEDTVGDIFDRQPTVIEAEVKE